MLAGRPFAATLVHNPFTPLEAPMTAPIDRGVVVGDLEAGSGDDALGTALGASASPMRSEMRSEIRSEIRCLVTLAEDVPIGQVDLILRGPPPQPDSMPLRLVLYDDRVPPRVGALP